MLANTTTRWGANYFAALEEQWLQEWNTLIKRYPEETVVARTIHALVRPKQTLDAFREGQDLLLRAATNEKPGVLTKKIGPVAPRQRGSLISINFVIYVQFIVYLKCYK